MRPEDLHLLIHEEIYIIDQKHVEKAIESNIKPPSSIDIPILFIHNTNVKEELDLLSKIIDACKLDAKLFRSIPTEDEGVKAEKKIIFSDSEPNYYTPQQTEGSQIIYSKPLQTLINSREDKAKLWEALKAFI